MNDSRNARTQNNLKSFKTSLIIGKLIVELNKLLCRNFKWLTKVYDEFFRFSNQNFILKIPTKPFRNNLASTTEKVLFVTFPSNANHSFRCKALSELNSPANILRTFSMNLIENDKNLNFWSRIKSMQKYFVSFSYFSSIFSSNFCKTFADFFPYL